MIGLFLGLQNNSPLVDQAVSRVLVCLNDKNTKQMVSTMKGIPKNNSFSIDFDSLKATDSFVDFYYEEIPAEKDSAEMVK